LRLIASSKETTRMTGKTLDRIDWKILDELQDDARTPLEKIAEHLSLPPEDVKSRARVMEESGVIAGYRADVNPRKAGYSISVMISVSTDEARHEQIINDALAGNPEVAACWSVTGASDFVVLAHVPSLEFLEELLENLSAHGKLTTSIVLPRYGEKRGKLFPPRESMTD
jgi:Lrp/AsnC family leucine-responsive transcriptional regulator